MLIAITNFERLKEVQYRSLLISNAPLYKNKEQFEQFPFTILGKESKWQSQASLPENFEESAAVVCFDFYGRDFSKAIDEYRRLISADCAPYKSILYHKHQHEGIKNLIKEHEDSFCPPPILGVHLPPNSPYKTLIDLLLDADNTQDSNHKFVHDGTKPFRVEKIGCDWEGIKNNLEIGKIPELPPLLLRHKNSFTEFLTKIGDHYDSHNPDHINEWDKLKRLFIADEYIEVN